MDLPGTLTLIALPVRNGNVVPHMPSSGSYWNYMIHYPFSSGRPKAYMADAAISLVQQVSPDRLANANSSTPTSGRPLLLSAMSLLVVGIGQHPRPVPSQH